jgi:hypothetical protein
VATLLKKENTCAWVPARAAADYAPMLSVGQEGEEERHCSLSSVMGKAGGEGVSTMNSKRQIRGSSP